jgi:hypothetical protein
MPTTKIVGDAVKAIITLTFAGRGGRDDSC